MERFKRVLYLAVATLVLGAVGTFITSGCGAQRDAPSGVASAGTSAGTEEYKVLGMSDVPASAAEVEKLLNDNAKEGWKLRVVGIMGGNYYVVLAR